MARICVIRQFYFPLDPRVRREVEALLLSGHEVDVICLARPEEARYEHNGRLTIRRVPLYRRRGGLLRYLVEYAGFLLIAMLLSGALHVRRRYDLVQVNSMPDALVFAAFIPRLFGARVLLDLHECMPEFFATKFRTQLSHPVVRGVVLMEQASIRFADFVITCTEQMREKFVERGACRDKIAVILNSANENLFDVERYPPKARQPDRFTLICHGTVEERYGQDTVIRAAALLKDRIPGLRVNIIGEGSYLESLRRLAEDLDVEDHVYFSGRFVSMPELLQAIATADAGVVAMKQDPFRDLTQCNKMYDLITMRKPAIVSRTRSVEAYFDDSCFQFFASDNEHDLARAIHELYLSPELGDQLVRKATRVNEPYRWPHQSDQYRRIVHAMLTDNIASEQSVASLDSPARREDSISAERSPNGEGRLH